MTKREREESAQATDAFKHARVDTDEAAEAAAHPEAALVPQSKLQGVQFPVEIAALPHILRHLEYFLLTPEEAMAEAAATGEVDWVKELLDRFDCILIHPLQLAAASGHAAVVAELLHELIVPGTTPARDTWQGILDAVSVAGEKEHLGVLQVLLPALAATGIHERKEAAYNTVSAVLEDAAARGSLDVAKFVIAQAAPIFSNFLEEEEGSFALGRAISAQQMDVVEYLLNLSVDGFRLDYIRAYDAALAAGVNELADRIYDIYSRTVTGRRLLVELADYNYVHAVKHLLGKGVDLDLVGEAFEKAAMGSAVAVVEFLWSSFSFSAEVFDRVFEHTATSGWKRSEMIPTLYRMQQPSAQVIDRVFRATDSVAVLRLLLENEQVPNDAVIAAFERAAGGYSRDRFAILQLLYKRCIPSRVLTETLLAAATQGNTRVVKLLRGDCRISSEALDHAFVDSALSGSGSRMKAMCKSQLVSPEVILKAFQSAVTCNQPREVAVLASCLSVETHVPRHFKDSALVFAAKQGQLQTVETLNNTEQGEWPLSVLQEALEVARNNPVRNYIRTIACNQLFNRRSPGRLEAVMKCLADWSEEPKA